MSPQEIVDKMMSQDMFSQWMGIEITKVSMALCEAKMKIREDMVNGFDICHGGITFSLADSVFAFASNTKGIHSVSIETSISHIASVHLGDVITAKATEVSDSSKIARYDVVLYNQSGKEVAIFHGTAYKKDSRW
jgi:acyl-CoA thioesterase